MTPRFLPILIFIFLCSANVFGQALKSTKWMDAIVKPISGGEDHQITLFTGGPIGERKDEARNLMLNQEAQRWIWDREPEKFTTQIPLPTGGSASYTFVRNRVLAEGFFVETSDGRRLEGKEYQGLQYKLEGNSQVGGLSFREDGVFGMISHLEGGAYNIGETSQGLGKYVIVDDRKQGIPSWRCDYDEHLDMQEMNQTPTNKNAVSCKKVRTYFEADFDLYKKAGNSVSGASTFITGFFNLVAQLYQNESITLEISSIFVWTSSDPYVSETSPSTFLLKFATNRPVAGVNGNLAHMVSTRNPNLGGIAYTGVLCNSSTVHGLSNIYYSYSALPTYSWTVGCVTHEIGHNFGSKHTHWCGWDLPNGTKGRIDSCYAGEAFNGVSCGTVTKARPGTVMSYCHITLGGINFNLGFGPLPGNAIRNGLNNATCISSSTCLGTAAVKADSTTNKDKNYIITITIPANHNATSWKLMEGSTMTHSGTLTGTASQTLNISFSGKNNGTYNYTAILTSSTGATTTSAITSVTVAVPVAPASTGNCVISNLSAWFDASGKMNFRYNINPVCTTYTVSLCRYNMTNPSVAPIGTETPSACSVRNGMTAYVPTTAEITAGLISRVASPQPGNMTGSPAGNYWYSVDVICNSNNCSTPSRTRSYIFVYGN